MPTDPVKAGTPSRSALERGRFTFHSWRINMHWSPGGTVRGITSSSTLVGIHRTHTTWYPELRHALDRTWECWDVPSGITGGHRNEARPIMKFISEEEGRAWMVSVYAMYDNEVEKTSVLARDTYECQKDTSPPFKYYKASSLLPIITIEQKLLLLL